MTESFVTEIRSALDRERSINPVELRRWMQSEDDETQGGVYEIIVSQTLYSRVESPGLSFEEVYDFVTGYYQRCIRENPSGEWINNRFSACLDCANWIIGLWSADNVPSPFHEQVKQWLARVYKEGSPEVKEMLSRVTLSRLFARVEIARSFEDWRDDPELRTALEAGLGDASRWKT